jgi:hemoglobin-like flavoprotein
MTSQEFIEAVRQAARIMKKDLDVATLRRSFATALRNDPHLVGHFYERLFAAHPEVRGLFPRYLEHQETAFERMLLEILDHLEDGAWLQLHLFALGTRHTHLYKVPPDPNAYGWIGSALLATLAEAIRSWDDKHRQAWTDFYNMLVARMLVLSPVSEVLG